MEKVYDFYQRNRDYILFAFLLVLVTVSELLLFYYFTNAYKRINHEVREEPKVSEEKLTEDFVVDIKGEVKRPGVYILKNGKRVIDVVRKAGGFTKNADTSANNFSMKIKDEMVIVVYSKDEIADYLVTKEKESQVQEMCNKDISNNDSCIQNEDTNSNIDNAADTSEPTSSSPGSNNNSSNGTNNEANKLISINTASKEELMTLPGIGEAKALSIIEYRKTNKFEKIEDIKNVSGIGDALFEKIKDLITTEYYLLCFSFHSFNSLLC